MISKYEDKDLEEAVKNKKCINLQDASFTSSTLRNYLRSFKMAHQNIEHLGEVDIISDAINIKNLLKMPYSSANVSIMVHKIRGTLLLENFDILPGQCQNYKKMYRDNKESVWENFQNFVVEQLFKEVEQKKDMLSPDELEEIDYDTLLVKCLLLGPMVERANGALKDNLWENNNFINRFINKIFLMSQEEILDLYQNIEYPQNSPQNPHLCQSLMSLIYDKPVPIEWPFQRLMIESKAGVKHKPDNIINLSNYKSPKSHKAYEDSLTKLISNIFDLNQNDAHFHPTDNIEDSIVPCILKDNFKETDNNYLWKFEDLRMLIHSDLPIFGGGKYPAVSLRLRDLKKPPINVLTGLDYWLDNLMCNVPELMMCYHLDGIVKKYEMFKTEEIPQQLKFVAPNSSCKEDYCHTFNPNLIQDLARNILSFIRMKCTQEGHTYWLFKGQDDDVVKLYDLSSLVENFNHQFPLSTAVHNASVEINKADKCAKSVSNTSQHHTEAPPLENVVNPYSLPVAFLLYRVALNMKSLDRNPEMSSSGWDENDAQTYMTLVLLLQKCRELVNDALGLNNKLQGNRLQILQLFVSATYLLADVYVPINQDPLLLIGHKTHRDIDNDCGTSEDEISTDKKVKNKAQRKRKDWVEASVSVNKLIPKSREDKKVKGKCGKKSGKDMKLCNTHVASDDNIIVENNQSMINYPISLYQIDNLHERCKFSLRCVAEGLQTTEQFATEHGGADECSLTWSMASRALLLEKSFSIYAFLTNLAMNCCKFGRASKYLKMCLTCYECLNVSLDKLPQLVVPINPQQLLLNLTELGGDFHVRSPSSPPTSSHKDDDDDYPYKQSFTSMLEDFNYMSPRDVKIIRAAKDLQNYAINYQFTPGTSSKEQKEHPKLSWIFQLSPDLDKNLLAAGLAYQKAIVISETEDQSAVGLRIRKKLANLKNETANHYFQKALALFQTLDPTTLHQKESCSLDLIHNGVNKMCEKSEGAYSDSIKTFRELGDHVNCVLLICNKSRLPLLRAQLAITLRDSIKTPTPPSFTLREKFFYYEALELLRGAQSLIHVLCKQVVKDKDTDGGLRDVKSNAKNVGDGEVMIGESLVKQLSGQVNWQMMDINRLIAQYIKEREVLSPQANEEILSCLRCANELLDHVSSHFTTDPQHLSKIASLYYDTGTAYFEKTLLCKKIVGEGAKDGHVHKSGSKKNNANISKHPLALANIYYDKAVSIYSKQLSDPNSSLRVEIQRLSFYKHITFEFEARDVVTSGSPNSVTKETDFGLCLVSSIKSVKHLQSMKLILTTSIKSMLGNQVSRENVEDVKSHAKDTLLRLVEILCLILQASNKCHNKQKEYFNDNNSVGQEPLAEHACQVCLDLRLKLLQQNSIAASDIIHQVLTIISFIDKII